MPAFEPVTPKATEQLRWQRFTDYRHTRNQHWVSVAAPEVSKLAAELPVAFRAKPEGGFQLAALVGLTKDHNHCLDADDRWRLDYVPALWRVHPFKMLPPKGGKPTERTLCFDTQSPWVSSLSGEYFFDPRSKQPKLSQPINEIVQFLLDLEKHFYKTEQAIQKLSEVGALQTLRLDAVGASPLQGFYQVDEDKFNQLSDSDWLSLRRCGGLALAYAQMISSQHLLRLKRWQNEVNHAGSEPNLDHLFGSEKDELFRF